MFIDQAEIIVKAGDGGNGCLSFRREKFIPRGGPDGGDGGHGGSVFLRSSPAVVTLLDFSSKHHWNAQRGQDGAGKNCFGKNGEDLIIDVPPGTIIYDINEDLILRDLDGPDQTVCVAHGGRGGKGNKHFATATRQTPQFAEPGKPGRQRTLRLELKLIADIGLLGLPNAGKSTFLSRTSSARPKIAPYPFTTIQPNLGIVELSDQRRIVIADLPGLIEGSHKGHGLGHDFLRHIERTRILAHLIDIAPDDESDPLENYHMIRRELQQYSKALEDKKEFIIAAKMDLDSDHEKLHRLQKQLDPKTIWPVSSVTGTGLKEVLEQLWQELQTIKKTSEQNQTVSEDQPLPPTTLPGYPHLNHGCKGHTDGHDRH